MDRRVNYYTALRFPSMLSTHLLWKKANVSEKERRWVKREGVAFLCDRQGKVEI
jgi:hypothetical protein